MKIKLSNIHHNPHRNMKRNPINKDQVNTLIASFKRNGTWPNVVVRSKPGERGQYELAYGHHRHAAMIKTGLTTAEFIVQEIDDWGMYTAMVDENESQQVVTPELVYENIESGINFLEPVIKNCETLDEYRSLVERSTTGQDLKDDAYQQVRNQVLSGEGLGVSFLSRELPGERSTERKNIQVVVDTHYEKTKAKAKDKRAAAKRKESEAKRKASDAADSQHKAAKLKAEADQLDAEANKLATEAKKLRDTGVSQDILLSFDTVYGMTEFASTVKASNIPKARHRAAYEEIKDESARHIRRKLETWWFVDSGKAQAQRDKARREGWKRKYRDKSLDEFAAELTVKLRNLTKEIKAVAEFADMIETKRIKTNLLQQVNIQYDELSALAEALEHKPEAVTVEDAVSMKRLSA